VKQLASDELDWSGANTEAVVRCLRGTFEAVALLWREFMHSETSATKERFGEGMTALMLTLVKHDALRLACGRVEVKGPLVLAVGAASEATRDEERDRIGDIANEVLSDDPKSLLDEWSVACPERKALLDRAGSENNLVQSLLASTQRLLGIADVLLVGRQEPWELLEELRRKEESSEADDLFREADLQYAKDDVWLHYKTARASGRPPEVHRVKAPVCDSCHQRLPEFKKGKLEKGQAVVCSCGTVLLFGKRV